jgi:drug/metabolite transporter (DMT)-like permease
VGTRSALLKKHHPTRAQVFANREPAPHLGLVGIILASQGSLIYALTPAAIAVGAVIALSERVSRRRAAGIALSIAGVTWLAVSGETSVSSRQSCFSVNP